MCDMFPCRSFLRCEISAATLLHEGEHVTTVHSEVGRLSRIRLCSNPWKSKPLHLFVQKGLTWVNLCHNAMQRHLSKRCASQSYTCKPTFLLDYFVIVFFPCDHHEGRLNDLQTVQSCKILYASFWNLTVIYFLQLLLYRYISGTKEVFCFDTQA